MYLTKKQIKDILQENKRRIDELTAEQNKNREEIKNIQEMPSTEDGDDAHKSESLSHLFVMMRNKEAQLNQLLEGFRYLNTLPEEDFGYCEDCGVEIGYDRLMLLPYTKLCADCATAEDKKKRLYK